jgi:hypothetical protein
VQLSVLPGKLHGLTTLAAQDAVLEDILTWAADRIGEAAAPDDVEGP